MTASHELAGVPAELWRRVALARHRLLMLDYDGTLAPFRPVRSEAVPPPRLLALLAALSSSSHTSVAIISGRPSDEVARLIALPGIVIVGEHGWEQRSPQGEVLRIPLDPAAEAALDSAEQVAREMGWGERLERKHSGVVLHTRGCPGADARAVEERCADAWQRLATRQHLRLDRIDGGVELRARGRDKGAAVLSLMSQAPPGTLGVFAGDDVSDEDAFHVVRDFGFGVRVGGCDRPSLAVGRLPSCEAVPTFLEEWLRVAGAAPGGVGGGAA